MDDFLYISKVGLFHSSNMVFVVHKKILISIFVFLRRVRWDKVLRHRLYLQEVPQAEAALRHPVCHLDQFAYRPAAEGA